MKIYFVIIFFILFQSCKDAQVIYNRDDLDICSSKFEFANQSHLSSKSISEIITEIGKSFIGSDYEAHTLDQEEEEKLIIHLTGLDCYTFLESTLAFAICIKKGDTTFLDFQKELLNIRYRDGALNQYPSRLHYFSDWIYNLNQRGIIEDITQKLGGREYPNNVFFMSKNREKYLQLKNNSGFADKMKIIENQISSRLYYYIPQEQIKEIENKIHSGDLIGITTNIPGLDIAHTGIAIRMADNRIHLLHAPNIGKKVQISDLPLAEYIGKNKTQTGIMVARVSTVID